MTHMPDFEGGPDIVLRPTIIRAFTENKVRFRIFRFDVTHFGCDDKHPVLLYALSRPRPEIDRWMMGAETVVEEDDDDAVERWCDGIRKVARAKPPGEDFIKYATVFGRPWTLVVSNPVPLIFHQEKCLATMPANWKMLLRERTLPELDKVVIEADLDDVSEWDDSIELPVLDLLKERYGGAYGVTDD